MAFFKILHASWKLTICWQFCKLLISSQLVGLIMLQNLNKMVIKLVESVYFNRAVSLIDGLNHSTGIN